MNKKVIVLFTVMILIIISVFLYSYYCKNRLKEASKAYLSYIDDVTLTDCYGQIQYNTGLSYSEMLSIINTEENCFTSKISIYLTGLNDYSNQLKYVFCPLTSNREACDRIKTNIDRSISEMNLSLTMQDIYYQLAYQRLECQVDYNGNLKIENFENGTCNQYNYDTTTDFLRPVNYLINEGILDNITRTAESFSIN